MKVKVCGLTREEDAQEVVMLGAWALGFIFYEASPRYINAKRAGAIIAKLPASTLCFGVFVNASAERVRETMEISGVSRAQLHGDETPDFAAKLKLPYVRAIRPEKNEDVANLSVWQGAEGFLVDAAVKGLYGGTGQTSSWQLAMRVKPQGRLILSGGLNETNVLDAIRIVQPDAIDVSSGVESRPGIKDHRKLKAFFTKVGSVK